MCRQAGLWTSAGADLRNGGLGQEFFKGGGGGGTFSSEVHYTLVILGLIYNGIVVQELIH